MEMTFQTNTKIPNNQLTTPPYDSHPTVAIFLLLGALRRITIPLTNIRAGAWRGPNFTLGHDPKGKVLGILGMGGIGTAVATRARAFGMHIQYHNRTRLPAAKEEEVGGGGPAAAARYVSFEDLLRTSDVLSVNVALNASTRHMISTAQFACMKDGVVLVNTARGPIVDEAALVAALESGKVFAAGLDVYEEEPRVHPGLLGSEKVVLLPHVGTATWETQKAMEVLVLENLRAAVEGRGLITQVPEQKK
jgi:lactate dehydrogenase-like 2-hydroxyacid dehydrogenase